MFTAIAVVLSETASNTAAANVVVPTAIAVAKAAGVSPLEPGLGATLGASLGLHDADLDAAERHRVQQRLHSHRHDDAPGRRRSTSSAT